jgi:phenylalanine-4-hydroxylase
MPGLQLLFFILFFLIGNLEELLVILLREQMPVHQRERLEKEDNVTDSRHDSWITLIRSKTSEMQAGVDRLSS